MTEFNQTQARLIEILKNKYRDVSDNVQIPPPAFSKMKGQTIEFDIEKGYLKIKFPVLDDYLNPFGNMQGGMVAAAIDNTLGPLSMLVGPPNFTRDMIIKYRKFVPLEINYIIVTGNFIERINRRLFFTASVVDKNTNKLATAKSIHWIVNN